jgi:hypothetical protein
MHQTYPQSIANQLAVASTERPRRRRISKTLFQKWREHFTLDGLRGLRYGQSFCNYFDISDNILYHLGSAQQADQYIRAYYLNDRRAIRVQE